MQLNKQDLDELRRLVVRELRSVSDSNKVKLDKELLEQLLFDTIICNKDTNDLVKLPIWSGTFLRKLDLSEISFTNVSWSLLKDSYYGVACPETFDNEMWNKFISNKAYNFSFGRRIDYSYTNANIDFATSWEAGSGSIKICYCDFSGVDLSNNDLSKLDNVYESSIANANLKITPEMFPDLTKNIFKSTDLSNNDLSNFYLSEKDLFDNSPKYLFDNNCNLSNTGIHISFDGNINFQNEKFNEMLQNSYLDGCIINNQLVPSQEERIKRQEEIKKEYLEYKRHLQEYVKQSISKQKVYKRK